MPSSERVLAAIGRILRPIVRILIRNGVPSDAVTQLVRKTYVDVAAEEFRLDGKRQTVSRISVLTGLHRKEVARLLEADSQDLGAAAAARHRATVVLTAWLREPHFLDRKGDPIDLPFAGKRSFSELVRRFSGDMKPRAMADELLASGALEQIGGKLRLTARGYVPSADVDGQIAILGADVTQFIETIDHNLRRADKLFQRKVEYRDMPVNLAAEFKSMSAKSAQHILEELDRWLAARAAESNDSTDGTVTLGLGIFQIEQPEQRSDEREDDGHAR